MEYRYRLLIYAYHRKKWLSTRVVRPRKDLEFRQVMPGKSAVLPLRIRPGKIRQNGLRTRYFSLAVAIPVISFSMDPGMPMFFMKAHFPASSK